MKRNRKKAPKEEQAPESGNELDEAAAANADHEEPEQTLEFWQDRALRAQAEMANMRRRLEADVEERTRNRMEALFHELITLTDHMDLALSSLPEEAKKEKSLQGFVQGIQAIDMALRSTLERFGLQAIQPSGETAFDPDQHEAVYIEDREDLEKPQLELLRRGFRMGHRILRPAQVRLLQPPKAEPQAQTED
ncbi:MAG: nucleotide exchange factor GrpE [Planctomycetota bacterium]|nr:MAG: nucleotide exchange factor GrpE [Planctomycetota bacterium]